MLVLSIDKTGDDGVRVHAESPAFGCRILTTCETEHDARVYIAGIREGLKMAQLATGQMFTESARVS